MSKFERDKIQMKNKKEKKIKEGKVNIGRYNCIHDKVVLYQI